MKKLDDIEKTNPFKVPDNYFIDLSETINSKIKQSESKSVNYNWRKIAVAAVVVFLLLSSILIKVVFFKSNGELIKTQFVDNSVVVNMVDEHTIVNAMIEDTTLVLQDKTDKENTDTEEDVDYVAESMDYESLLAEL